MRPWELYEDGALDILHGWSETDWFDLVICDPPFGDILDQPWDKWPRDGLGYFDWLESLLYNLERAMSPTGTLYLFAWPSRVHEVQKCVEDHGFDVVSSVTWNKGGHANGFSGGGMPDWSTQRSFRNVHERILVAEKRGAEWRYQEALKEAGRQGFGTTLVAALESAGWSREDLARRFPSHSGGVTGCVSNWTTGTLFPSPAQYAACRQILGAANLGPYEEALERWENYRRAVRRRTFKLERGSERTDTWTFPVPAPQKRRHPCEKPVALARQIVEVSSEPSDLVLDVFAGSGVFMRTAVDHGRRVVGIESDPTYAAGIRKMMQQGGLFVEG